jgi:hypothetical protein
MANGLAALGDPARPERLCDCQTLPSVDAEIRLAVKSDREPK